MENKDLSKELKKVLENPEEYPHVKTVDDFFDLMEVPTRVRNDFAFAAILNNLDNNEKKD